MSVWCPAQPGSEEGRPGGKELQTRIDMQTWVFGDRGREESPDPLKLATALWLVTGGRLVEVLCCLGGGPLLEKNAVGPWGKCRCPWSVAYLPRHNTIRRPHDIM